MMIRFCFLLLLLLLASPWVGRAQTNPRAHYTNGQVWVTWDVESQVLNGCVSNVTYAVSNGGVISITNCVQATYAIWFSTQPVTNPATATLIGRLFPQEWSATLLRGEIQDTTGVKPTGFRIPDGLGSYRTLATNEGVFVHTVRSNFTGYYGVRAFGAANISPSHRVGPVTATFSTNDPPTCHSQTNAIKSGYPVEWFTTWVDGDNDSSAARPDFPLMANAVRRGVAHSFFVMAPKTGTLPTNNIPAVLALHSGDNNASMWLPGQEGFQSVGVAPTNGYVVALEDRNYLFLDSTPDAVNSRWFGWVPSFDPFTDVLGIPFGPTPWTNNLPASNEVVQTYTLNRLNWTLDWLIAHKAIDPDRVSVMGHSGGSMGGLVWSHAFPDRFASANLFGNGLGDFPNTYMTWKMQGTREQNLATTLTNRAGLPVHTFDVNYLAANTSPQRDTPFTRIFIGKREENWITDDNTNYLSDIIENVQTADALGTGVAFFWDLREHGVARWTFDFMTNNLGPTNVCLDGSPKIPPTWTIEDFWVPTIGTQFARDDCAQQSRYRARQSYPAFFNCQLRGGHGSLGYVLYTNNTVPYNKVQPYDGDVTCQDGFPPFLGGDDRGTWGGYFDWEQDTLVDTTTTWQCTVFLIGTNSALAKVEICPDASRVCDIAIRRPQNFKPTTGTLLGWRLEDAFTYALLASGTTVAGADDLVSVPNLAIPRDPSRVRLIVSPVDCLAPVLYATLLTNSQVELRWLACTNYAYQLEWTTNFQAWAVFSPPLAAPPGGGWMTYVVAATNAQQFFRLHLLTLTNSIVPDVPGVYSLYLTDGGIPRHYRLNIPAGYDAAMPAPLALILHGHNQSADTFAALHPELATYASARGVILVLPDSTSTARGTSWNDGRGTAENPVDDVGFMLALIERLDATLSVDRKRVYMGGFSNGGHMCHWLAGHTTNVFAALAAVCSAIAGEVDTPGVLVTNPPPTGPISALIVNATNDCKRPSGGGTNDSGALQPPAFASVAHYTNADFCASLSAIYTNSFITNNGHIGRFAECPANVLGPMALVTNLVIREHYQLTCAPGTEVLFVTLTDGGHQWPNAGDNVGFDANREVLDFFLNHCNCNATGAVETLVVPTAPGLYELRLCDQGYSRLFRLAIPAGYNPAVATPIVFAFHGGAMTSESFSAAHPALFAKCNAEGVILVLPQATIHPQTGETLWGNKPFDVVVDDVAFFTNLLEHLDAALNLNRKRVYACGFSNGGALSHYLASTTTNLLAAIGPVCTQTGWNDPVTGLIPAPPPPLEPLPVLMVRGTLDPDRPFGGGTNTEGVLCRSAADDVAYWTAANACVGAPVTTTVFNVTTDRYQVCVGTTEVILVAVGGMAHLWPDAADGFNFDANVTVIEFLLSHVRP